MLSFSRHFRPTINISSGILLSDARSYTVNIKNLSPSMARSHTP